jgi:hypothetical protein
MLPFGVKVVYSGYFICISIERSEVTYIVDPFEEIEDLNIFDANGKVELKDMGGNFFRGIAVMKNMLGLERKIPEGDKIPLLEAIVN